MPNTWQDVLVSALAVVAAVHVLRPYLPARWRGSKARPSSACDACASGSACEAVPPITASSTPVITIQRKPQ